MSNKFRTAEQIAADKRRIDAEEKLQSAVKALDEAKQNLAYARKEYIEHTNDVDSLSRAGGAFALAEAGHAIALKEWNESRVRRPRKSTQPAEVTQA